jgi:hypothetical protein
MRMRRLNSRRAAILAVAMLAIAPSAAGASSNAHRAAHWILSAARSHGAGHNELLGVAYAGITPWAVGDFYDGRSDRTLVERYTGGTWSITPSPSVGTKHNQLDAIAGISTSDVWAVGRYEPLVGQERTLAEHWDGRHWKLSPTPNQGVYHNELDAVVARGPYDVWAVGHWDLHASISDEALVEHYDGVRWRVVPCKHPALSHSGFTGLAAVPGTRSLWAVGYRTQGGVTRTLAEHYDGLHWTIVSTPNLGLSHNELDGVTALSPTNVWAVGFAFLGTVDRPLVEHFDGRHWSVVGTPASGALHETLAAVAAAGPHDVVAVGTAYFGAADRTLVLQWDGRHWTAPLSPDAGTMHNELQAVAMRGSLPPVAVGVYYSGASDRALALRRVD